MEAGRVNKKDYYQGCSDYGIEILKGLPGFDIESLFYLECLDVIDYLGCNFYSGNTLKYLWRLSKKSNEIHGDLLKAYEYLLLYSARLPIEENRHLWCVPLLKKLKAILLNMEN
jgi:hypothetical protein